MKKSLIFFVVFECILVPYKRNMFFRFKIMIMLLLWHECVFKIFMIYVCYVRMFLVLLRF